MNKFKKEIDEIKLSETEKIKMLNKIKENKKKETSFGTYALRFAVFLIAFALFSGASYAFVKAFIFDDTMQQEFDKTSDELKNLGVEGTELNQDVSFEDATITINQTVYDEKELYISLEITGKNEALYADTILITEGNKFDESLLEEVIYDDGTISRNTSCTSNSTFCEGGWSLLNESDKTLNYSVSFATHQYKDLINKPLTIRIYIESKPYDVSFILGQNEIASKEIEFNTIVYNKNDIIATVKSIKITPLHLIVNLDYNVNFEMIDEETLNDIDYHIYNYGLEKNSNNNIIYTNGQVQNFFLKWTRDKESFNNPAAWFDPENIQSKTVIDINTVKEVTINGITFNLNKDN